MLVIENPELKNVLCFLDEEWQEKQAANPEQIGMSMTALVNEIIEDFRKVELDSGKRKAISSLHQQELNAEEELSTLEELLNQTRQQHGL